ncbi:hypothetical protein C1645_739822 [Glomus cerebriforme]|uniref:Galactose oxidase n=1 Tax=Glomus cerebriforme TaxID=658196 RepID=A0A397SSF6_9GLOM|nr:hypothetical protein C1645_739822 [Glomus cerebriforme]
MSKNSLIYFILWILLQVLVKVNCQTSPFIPTLVCSHTATLIDNKLYILGGKDKNAQFVGKEFFYLDVSFPFNTQNLLWHDLSSINMLSPHNTAASVKGGANNNTLFLYVGYTLDPSMALVYTFDSQSNSWSIPKITGDGTIRKRGITGVIDNNEKMYLWGGCSGLDAFFNDMLILDTINLGWGKGSLINAPTPRCDYGVTILPNNNIIYIGGYNDNTILMPKNRFIRGNALTLSEVYIYDTINDNWSIKMTSGKIPSNRLGFSSTLGLDGQRIIIFGGAYYEPEYLDTSLYVLDLTNFNWYIPNISGKIPTPRLFHKANVIGKYIVISFGRGYDKSIESDILLLDISNNEEYVWTTTFDPSVPNNTLTTPSLASSSSFPLQPSTSNNTSKSTSNITATFTGAIIGSLFSGLLLSSFGAFFLYKWKYNRQKQKDSKPIHKNNNYNQEEIIPTQENIHNYNQANNNNYNHGQEIIQVPISENSTNNGLIVIPTSVMNKNYGQEIIQQTSPVENKANHELIIPVQISHVENTTNHEPMVPVQTSHENTTNHEPVISTPENSRNYNHEQEITSTFIDDKLQIFKDELLQAVKQEINQNVKNQ